MADVFLLDRNRASLKAIFARHCSASETLSYDEFRKFATAVRIYPVPATQDLTSTLELKRLFYKSADRFTFDDPKVELSYLQFEKLLKLISSHSFSLELPPADRVQLLLAHVQTHCLAQYNVQLQTDSGLRRGESVDVGSVLKPMLRKQSSLTGLSPSRKLLKPHVSLSRLNIDSASTERLSVSRAKVLTQKVQRLYQMMTPEARRQHVKVKARTMRKAGLSVESPRFASDRITSVPESSRRLSEMLSQMITVGPEVSVKLVSPLQLSFTEGPAPVLDKVRRALSNLETKTDLVLRRTRTQGRRKLAMKRLSEMHELTHAQVTSTQRSALYLSFLRWKLAVRL